MKRKIRFEVSKTILITLTFISIPKFVISHPVEEQRDETLTVRQRHAILEPQSVVDYVEDDGSIEFGFDSSTNFPKREVKTIQVTTTPVEVVTTEVTTTEFSATEAETREPPLTVSHPKKRQDENFECYFVGNVGVISHCVRYLSCPTIGAMPESQHCLIGEHFDLKKRLCMDKDEAECDSDKICPNDDTEYSTDNGDLKCNNGIPFPKNETEAAEAPKPQSENKDAIPNGDPNDEVMPMVKRGMEYGANILNVTNSKGTGGIANGKTISKDSEGITNGEANSKNVEKVESTPAPIIEGIIIGIPKSKSAERMNGTNAPLVEGFINELNLEGTEGNGVRVTKGTADKYVSNATTTEGSGVRVAKSSEGKDVSNTTSPKGNGTLANLTAVIEVNKLLNLTANDGNGVQNNSKRSANGEGVHRSTGDGANNKSTVINIMVAVPESSDIGLPRPGTKRNGPQIVHVRVIQTGNGNQKIIGINETLAKQIGKQLIDAIERRNSNTNQNQQPKNDVKGEGKQRALLQARIDAKLKANQSLAAESNKTGNSNGNSGSSNAAMQIQQQLENLMRDKSKGQVSEVRVIKIENGKEKTTKMSESLINQAGAQLLVVALNQGRQSSHHQGNGHVMMMDNRTYSSAEQTWHHGIPQNPMFFNTTNEKSQGLAGHHVRHNF